MNPATRKEPERKTATPQRNRHLSSLLHDELRATPLSIGLFLGAGAAMGIVWHSFILDLSGAVHASTVGMVLTTAIGIACAIAGSRGLRKPVASRQGV